MPLVDYALVSLQELKNYLGIETAEFDYDLTRQINMFTSQIEAYCQRPFVRREFTEYVEPFEITWDCNYGSQIFLFMRPVNSIVTFKDANDVEIQTSLYVVRSYDGLIQGWVPAPYRGKYSITYNAGLFDDTAGVDPLIKEACMLSIAKYREDPDAAIENSVSISSLSVSYDTTKGGFVLPVQAELFLQDYRFF